MARTFAGGAATDNVASALASWPAGNTLSIAAWINLAALDATSRRLIVGLTASNNFNIAFTSTAISFNTPNATTNGGWTIVPPSVGQWHLFVATYDGSNNANNPTIYLDGISQTVTTATAPVGAFVQPFSSGVVIGNNASSGGVRCWNGSIQEFPVWDVVLSGANVTSLWNASLGIDATKVVPASLRGYWKLNGLSPEPDYSVNNNNPGTVTGTTVLASPYPAQPTTPFWGAA